MLHTIWSEPVSDGEVKVKVWTAPAATLVSASTFAWSSASNGAAAWWPASSRTQLCSIVPLFVRVSVTSAPAGTEALAGEKENSDMDMDIAAALGPPQAASPATSKRITPE